MYQWKTVALPCGYQILVLISVFKVLLPTCKLDWIPNSSNITKKENCPFPKVLQTESIQLAINCKEVTTTKFTRTSDDIIRDLQTENQENLSEDHCLSSLHL